MSTTHEPRNGKISYTTIIWQAIKGQETDYTQVGIRKAIILLAIPMMLEMIMESVFALVDLYFVGHLPNSSQAIQTVGLTESVLTIVYSLAIGMSMAATAVVARRIGEKDPKAAARAGAQAIIIAVTINIVISIAGLCYAKEVLLLMGATEDTARVGLPFTQIMLGGSVVIMLLFLINGIFRGAGNAAIAMKSLWIANLANCILCPLLIRGMGPIPALGLTGAAIATTIGRGFGVLFQVYHLFKGSGALKLQIENFKADLALIGNIVKIAAPGILQFVIASCSWIFLANLVAVTGGDEGSAGYQTALRLMMFFLLPAWGLSNAAATLVGQNLGAKEITRAEEAVKITITYTVSFMAVVTILFLTCGPFFVSLFSSDEKTKIIAVDALRTLSYGFIIYGCGMVLTSAFNGAGDTWTPTKINFVAFWLFQIPLAYFLARYYDLGPRGVFWAIPSAEVGIAVAAYFIFKKGKWKKIKI